MSPFNLLFAAVLWVLILELLGLLGVLWLGLGAATAAGYTGFLSVRFLPSALAVGLRHRDVLGHVLLAGLYLAGKKPIEAAVYLALATHGGRELIAEFRRRVVRPAHLTWKFCTPCARATGWLVRIMSRVGRWVQGNS